jgi:putative FmdB family regulatory protein
MPTYEYKCDACGHAFEKFQSITSSPIKKCPKCGKSKVRRLIGTGSGMIFKGSGFYITDYRSESYQNAAKADKGGSSGDAKPETKTDAKTDGKTETKSESKSDSKSDNKPNTAPQSNSSSTSKSESKAESKAESKPPPKKDPPASKSARKR